MNGLSKLLIILSLAMPVKGWSAGLEFAYSGRITDANGTPTKGPVTINVKFFDAETGGKQLGEEIVYADTPLVNGMFTVAIDLESSTGKSVLASSNVYVEITDTNAARVFPRQKIHTMPFAARVPTDGSTLEFDKNGKLKIVDGAITSEKIGNIPASKLDSIPPTKLDPIPPSKLEQSGAIAGQILKWDGTNWVPDNVTAATGGTISNIATGAGLTGGPITNTGTIALENSGVTPGTYPKVTVDTYGRVTLGSTLAAGDVPNIDAAKVTSGTFGAARIGADAVSSSNVANGSLLDADINAAAAIQVSKLGQTGAATNQVLQWNGSQWVPATIAGTGTVTSVGSGAGLTGGPITGTGSLALATSGVTPGTYPKVTVDTYGRATAGAALVAGDIPNLDAAKITTGTFATGQVPNLAASKITSGTFANARIPSNIDPAKIDQDGAGLNEALVWDGSQWSPAAVASGTVTSVGSGAGLTGGPITGTGSLALATSGVTPGTYPKVTVDTYGRATAGAALVAGDVPDLPASKITSGTIANARIPSNIDPAKIDQDGAGLNEALIWDGSQWSPAAVGSGTVTSVGSGAGLTGGPITGTGSLALATSGVTPGTYPKVTVDTYGRATAGAALVAGDIPNLDAAKTTSGTFAAARIPNLAASKITSGTIANARIPSNIDPAKIDQDGAGLNEALVWDGSQWSPAAVGSGTVTSVGSGAGLTGGPITGTGSLALATSGVTPGTYPKVTVDTYGRATAGASLVAGDIPNLDAAKTTSGTFAAARIPNLPASTITSGTFAAARIAGDSITSARIANNEIVDADINSSADIAITKIAECANGQIMKTSAGNWICASETDTDTKPSANCNGASEALQWNGSAFTCTTISGSGLANCSVKIQTFNFGESSAGGFGASASAASSGGVERCTPYRQSGCANGCGGETAGAAIHGTRICITCN
jgi:phage-related tail fiber protein